MVRALLGRAACASCSHVLLSQDRVLGRR